MVRYAILYFVLLVVFVALLAGPVVGAKFLDVNQFASKVPMNLIQPTGLNFNDTNGRVTGSCAKGPCPAGPDGAAAETGDSSSETLRRMMAY